MNRTPSDHDPFGSQPITEWLQGYQQGDDDGVFGTLLWHAVSDILCNYTKKKLRKKPTIDGPDGIANEAFFQLLKGLRADEFRSLKNRHDLLQLLRTLCERRAEDSKRREGAKKRGGGQVQTLANPADVADRSHVASHRGPTAEQTLEESFQELLELVLHHYRDRPEVEIFKCAYMSGMTDVEIMNFGLKDKQGKSLSDREIKRRRQAMLEFLRHRVRDEE